jgi:hypothetical protein
VQRKHNGSRQILFFPLYYYRSQSPLSSERLCPKSWQQIMAQKERGRKTAKHTQIILKNRNNPDREGPIETKKKPLHLCRQKHLAFANCSPSSPKKKKKKKKKVNGTTEPMEGKERYTTQHKPRDTIQYTRTCECAVYVPWDSSSSTHIFQFHWKTSLEHCRRCHHHPAGSST